MDKVQLAFEAVQIKHSIEQWEWDRRNADRDRYFASAGKKAGAGVFIIGLLVVLLSYVVMGAYLCMMGLGILLIAAMQEKGAHDRLRILDDQLSMSKRRLLELDAQLESE